ncbi:hypothetical protein DFQ27_008416 [Actinomortierella ambigua]|uniref:Uncharacterized protein n=1 Tax=Actinomortierella ambigua TaxID=1343610 RepID=A0A9P6PTU9_9FUNG|nr:hypothetical protein DFQ27_008416 [Actinomortierella ambigua]
MTATIAQTRLRIVVCFLFLAAVVLDMTWLLIVGLRSHLGDVSWRTWAGVVTEFLLLGIYSHAARGYLNINKWGRVASIVILSGFLLYLSCGGLYQYSSATNFYNCYIHDSLSETCALDRTWTTVVIIATCLAVVEALYTLYKEPLDRDEGGPKPNEIITVSPPHHPYGIQPNMTIPHGEGQHQPLLYQQPVYTHHQQPVYPIHQHQHQHQHHPYPIMQHASVGASAAMPLQQHIHPHQASFKYEDPVQPQYPPPPPQPYVAGNLPHVPGPTVTSVPQPGAAPTFTGRVSGISLASPIMPVAVSSYSPYSSTSPPLLSSPSPVPPPPTATATAIDYHFPAIDQSPASVARQSLDSPSIAAAVASPTMSSYSQAPSAHSSIASPRILVARSTQDL